MFYYNMSGDFRGQVSGLNGAMGEVMGKERDLYRNVTAKHLMCHDVKFECIQPGHTAHG